MRLAGERQRHRARENGRVVIVVDGEEQGLDVEGGRWYTICDEHGAAVPHDTLALARWHAPNPTGWCEDCQAETETEN